MKISKNYEEVKDFKLEKFKVYQLYGMQDSKFDSQQQSAQNNPIQPIYNSINEKFTDSKAMKYYRENCFLLAENQNLEVLAYEMFGFHTKIISKYKASVLSEIHSQHKSTESIDNVIDLSLNFEEFLDKATQRVSY